MLLVLSIVVVVVTVDEFAFSSPTFPFTAATDSVCATFASPLLSNVADCSF